MDTSQRPGEGSGGGSGGGSDWRVHRAPTGIEALVPWLIAGMTIAALHFGKSVLIPIILAVLISFLLGPIVGLLRRLRLPRAPAVVIAVLLALGSFAAISTIVVSEAATLSKDFPSYAQRVSGKVEGLRQQFGERFDFLTSERQRPGERTPAVTAREARNGLPAPTESGAMPVEIQEAEPTAIEAFRTFVVPILAPLETILIVLIVTMFILFQQEDLRDRMIRLMGAADLHRTTTALNDGAKRLSRYFFSQFILNSGFGAIVWIGLLLLDVPAAGLWGIVAGLLRFVPYVGSIIAAVGPLAVAAAVDPGWGLVIYVGLLFLILEPLAGYVIEPLLYGHSTGLSPFSVVVAALFWTWIWGPVGLVLSVPLTLTLVVMGRHLPGFGVFDILLGNRPALSPAESFYQRILAGRADDALHQAEIMLESMPLATYYDEVVLGALRLAAADVDRGAVARSAMHAVSDATRDIIAVLADHRDGEGLLPAFRVTTIDAANDSQGHDIVCMPGRGPLDAVVSMMAAQLLRRAGWRVMELSRERSPGSDSTMLDPGSARVLCILGLFDGRAPGRMLPLVTRMQEAFPGIAVLIGVRRDSEESLDENELALVASFAALCAGMSDQIDAAQPPEVPVAA